MDHEGEVAPASATQSDETLRHTELPPIQTDGNSNPNVLHAGEVKDQVAKQPGPTGLGEVFSSLVTKLVNFAHLGSPQQPEALGTNPFEAAPETSPAVGTLAGQAETPSPIATPVFPSSEPEAHERGTTDGRSIDNPAVTTKSDVSAPEVVESEFPGTTSLANSNLSSTLGSSPAPEASLPTDTVVAPDAPAVEAQANTPTEPLITGTSETMAAAPTSSPEPASVPPTVSASDAPLSVAPESVTPNPGPSASETAEIPVTPTDPTPEPALAGVGASETLAPTFGAPATDTKPQV